MLKGSSLSAGIVLAAMLACATLSWTGCNLADASAHASDGRTTLTLLTGPPGGAYSPLGRALADAYNSSIPTLHVSAVSTSGPEGAAANAAALEAGRTDLAFSRSDLAYTTFRGSEARAANASRLRSIAVVYTNAVHLIVSRKSGIARGEDMRGRRVLVGDANTGGTVARMVLQGYGLTTDDVQVRANDGNAMARFRNDDLDVQIFASAYPLASIDDVGPNGAVRLLSLESDTIDRLRSRYPFFKPAVIPAGTYHGQTEDIRTVGIDGLLLCRDSLPESVVYDLTRQLFEALPSLAQTQRTARLINVARAPATPIPLHPGAARYYRERDLFR
jgi:TRAP transporter TAXI family solute receptor